MARTVGIGIQDFSKVRENNYFYIDKTSFIKEWWENGDDATLITRPRRFGKTLNMSMLEQFFSLDYAGRGDLFEGLSIWEEEKYRNMQGIYPVISLSFAQIKEANYEKTSYRIRQLLMKQYIKFSFLKDSNVLSKEEIEYYDEMSYDMTEIDAPMALYQLSDYLHRYYGKKVIILLDEYDTPMQEAYVHGYWEELVSFIRSLFNSTFKANPWVDRSMMTGITRVSRESLFSDLNHLKVVTSISDDYATSFGFTEEEVFAALEEFDMGEEKEKVKFWYDGFIFGKHTDIYNPWSILNFLDEKKYRAYWVNTSANTLAAKLIQEGNRKIKASFEQLLNGGSIRCAIDEQVVYNLLGDNEEAVWSLLAASGYLKVLSYDKEDELEDGEEAMYELALTNFEVKQMFRRIVRDWFKNVRADYNDFVTAMLLGDLDAMNDFMNRMSLQIFSYFDTGNRPSGEEPERFYHGFVLGLMTDLNKEYIVTSNRESGFGRYDVVIEPKDKTKDAFILEFKVYNPKKENSLEDTVAAALKQIEDKQYALSLMNHGIQESNIRKYGFAFKGKKVLIGE